MRVLFNPKVLRLSLSRVEGRKSADPFYTPEGSDVSFHFLPCAKYPVSPQSQNGAEQIPIS